MANKKSKWWQLDRFLRALHRYTGLVIVPWLLVYATSAILLNHRQLVVQQFGIAQPHWEVVREVDFVPADDFSREPAEQAWTILEELGLAGPYRLQGKPTAKPLVIMRPSGTGNYRVTWKRQQSRVVVEKQRPFSLVRLIHFLHFQAGYGRHSMVWDLWAAIVDIASISMWVWAITGIYIWARWARRPMSWVLGGLCLGGGVLVFAAFVAAMCV